MANLTQLKVNPVALPALRGDLRRKVMAGPNLNDQVEGIVLTLWEDPQFQSYIAAVYPEQAVEGSIAVDDSKAADMIRNQAIKDNNPIVGNQKLAVLIKVLNNVVLRRYGISRNERREWIASAESRAN